MSKKNILFQSLLGGAMLALAFKGIASKLSQAKPTARPAASGTSFEAIDAFIEEQMNRLNLPGVALAIVDGDQITHVRGFGQVRPGGEAPTPQTTFYIGSLTKSFTALAVMQQVEAGGIELDAPVQRYLPWFRLSDPHASARVTVRHLLNQTSGLTTWCGWTPLTDLDDRRDASERQARALSTFQLTRSPGAAFEYSNMNYNLLGLVIEAVSGETYEDYLKSHIFGPLEMGQSYAPPDEAKQKSLAAGHRYWFWLPIPTRKAGLAIPRGSQASGQLISSAEDMAHYLIAQLNQGCYGDHQILSPAGMADLHRPAVAAYKIGSQSGQYAMGWYNEIQDQTRVVWHTGMVPDYVSYMALLPDQKKGVILLINANHFMMNPVITEIGSGLVALLAGQQPGPGAFGFSFASSIPWVMRALVLIPLLQILDVVLTTRRLRRWDQDPHSRPGRGRLWGQHLLLPLIPNLALAAAPVYLQVKKMLGFLQLFCPDFSWIAILCGAFAGLWAFLRTSLILQTLRKGS